MNNKHYFIRRVHNGQYFMGRVQPLTFLLVTLLILYVIIKSICHLPFLSTLVKALKFSFIVRFLSIPAKALKFALNYSYKLHQIS